MGLRASSGSPVNKSPPPAGPPTLDYGSYFGGEKKMYLELESGNTFNTDIRAIDFIDIFRGGEGEGKAG